nr:hypothetical protein Iba_chr04aCG19280 [Ipomoea batatas]
MRRSSRSISSCNARVTSSSVDDILLRLCFVFCPVGDDETWWDDRASNYRSPSHSLLPKFLEVRDITNTRMDFWKPFTASFLLCRQLYGTPSTCTPTGSSTATAPSPPEPRFPELQVDHWEAVDNQRLKPILHGDRTGKSLSRQTLGIATINSALRAA